MASHMIRLGVAVLIAFSARSVTAQETLDAVLARGYVANWLVCGPFGVDVPGGAVNASALQQATLGDTDPMAPLGGIAQVRPRHLLSVATATGEAIWQQAGTDSPSLDLSPFFPNASEGMAYAAFYVNATAGQQALFDLHSTFGARIWHNGLLIRQLSPGPLANIGVDRFVANFREGLNLIVIQVAGATFEALGERFGLAPRAFQERHLARRTLLENQSGYEIGLALHPVQQAGTVFAVPRLVDTGAFSGSGGDLRQDQKLVLFNASRAPSEPVGVVARSSAGVEATVLSPGPLFPAVLEEIIVPVSIGASAPGDTISVEVSINAGEASTSFTTSIIARPNAQPGAVYIVTGYEKDRAENPSQVIDTHGRLLALETQAQLHEATPAYGFEVGTVSAWEALPRARPEVLGSLRGGAARGAIGSRPVYSDPDHRLVSGEMLARNLESGYRETQRWLGVTATTDLGLGRPGIAPQWPQLLQQAGVEGMVSDLSSPMIPALSILLGPNGDRQIHRRKTLSPAPGSQDALHQSLLAQRGALLEMGIPEDIYIHRSSGSFPDAVLESAAALEGLTPRLLVEGSGADAFMRAISRAPAATRDGLPVMGPHLNREYPGMVAAHPDLKRAYALAEAELRSAETLATLAALQGARFPGPSIDYGWRQLLYWSTPERLGLPAASSQYADAMAAFRDVSALGNEIARKSGEFIGSQINTLGGGPPSANNARAVLVFNPSSVPYSGPCALEIGLPATQGIQFFDVHGAEVPIETHGLRRGGDRIDRVTVRFVAQNIPAMGYSTYYATPGPSFPQVRNFSDSQIDNERLIVIADPQSGDIVRITDKLSGREYGAGPVNSFVALREDPERTSGGRDLWTTGARRSPLRGGTVRMEQSPIRKSLFFEHDFAGGKLEREVTLYTGLDRVDFRTRLRGVRLDDDLIAGVFSMASAGRAPVFGERFGAIQGAKSNTVLHFRSGDGDEAQAALYPAHEWAALSPGDRLQIGLDQDIPLRPAYVIYGTDPQLHTAAKRLSEALTSRVVPAVMAPASIAMAQGLWRDDTYPAGGWPNLRQDPWMRILIGSPEQNPLSAAALGRLPQLQLQEIAARGAQGAAVYFEDSPDPERAPIPTLVLFGLSAGQSADFAMAAAESIAMRGVLAMPPAMNLSESAAPAADFGTALLFRGAALTGADEDGAMVMVLAHGANLPGGDAVAGPDVLDFHYALSPLDGDWREGQVAHQATGFNTIATAVTAPLQAGSLPPRHSFLSLPPSSPLVAALRPAPPGMGQDAHPVRDGVHLRMWEPYGARKDGAVTTAFPVRRGHETDLRGSTGATLEIAGNGITYQLAPYEVKTVQFFPQLASSVSGSGDIGPSPLTYSVPSSAYWHLRTGAPPPGSPPVFLHLRGDLEAESSSVVASVAHSGGTDFRQGMVQIQAPEGWILRPERFEFALRPGDFHREDIGVQRQPGNPVHGALVATAHFGTERVREVLGLGPHPLETELTRTHSQLKVTLRNLSASPVEGFLELISPTAYWGRDGHHATPGTEPRRAAIAVAPHDFQTVLFRLPDPDAVIPATLKIAANNVVEYRDIP